MPILFVCGELQVVKLQTYNFIHKQYFATLIKLCILFKDWCTQFILKCTFKLILILNLVVPSLK